jgi:glutaredoxin
MNTKPINVELLYFDGCPSCKRAWQDLLEVISEHDLEVAIRPVKIDSLEKADALHFAGSPTIKINGQDLEGYDGAGVMACRRYEENSGKGWPSKTLLAKRLLAVRGRNLSRSLCCLCEPSPGK